MGIIILALAILYILYMLYHHFRPKIEIVPLVKHYTVYLWYNKYCGPVFQGRCYKYLFTI